MTTTKKTTTTKKKNFTVKSSNELPPNPFIHEILELVNKQRSNAKRVEVLQKYGNDALKTLFVWNFDDTAISVLPEGHVPYKENDVPVGTDHTSLRREYKHLYNFVRGGNDSLSSLRRKTMFIQMLEGLHPEEAKILCLVKDKQLQTHFKVSKDIVSQAFPEIKWGGRAWYEYSLRRLRSISGGRSVSSAQCLHHRI